MIRIVTLEPFDEGDIAVLSRTLYQAFGLGTEHAGERPLPEEAEGDDGRYDAPTLVAEVEPIKTFADDKVLYLTSAPLSIAPGPLGEPPCWCFAQYGGEKAVRGARDAKAPEKKKPAAKAPPAKKPARGSKKK